MRLIPIMGDALGLMNDDCQLMIAGKQNFGGHGHILFLTPRLNTQRVPPGETSTKKVSLGRRFNGAPIAGSTRRFDPSSVADYCGGRTGGVNKGREGLFGFPDRGGRSGKNPMPYQAL